MIVTHWATLTYEYPHGGHWAEAEVEIEVEGSWSFDGHELNELTVRSVEVIKVLHGRFLPGVLEDLAREHVLICGDEIAERVVGTRKAEAEEERAGFI